MMNLYHTTSWRNALQALRSGKIESRAPFISLSSKPLFSGDIRYTDLALVLDGDRLGGQVTPVQYTERWAEAHPEQVAYIAGEGWQEQFVYPDDCLDEDGWEDEECMEQAWHEAEIDSFLWKRDEDEWITQREDTPLKVRGAVKALLVPSDADVEQAEALLAKVGLSLPVFVGRGASAVRVASRYMAANEMVEVKADLARLWSVVHLTPRYLGDVEIIHAKPPYHPYEDQRGFVIEDEETDRISVARTINDALKGLSEISGDGYHVYAAGPRKKGVKVTDPLQWWDGCPSSVGNEYGQSFDWTEYAEEEGIDPRDDYERENAVHLCVPDLKKTREKWLMKPTEMVWLGEYRNGKLRLTREQLEYLLDDVLRVGSDKRDLFLGKVRVASRHIEAARPIRLDRGEVERLLDRIYKGLQPYGKEHKKHQKAGTHRDALVMDSIVVRDVFGNDKEVFVALTAKPGRGGPVLAGGFGHVNKGRHKGQPIIIVQMNGSYTWDGLINSRVSRNELRSVLMHELSHAADKIKNEIGAVQGRIPTADEIDMEEYVNDPGEVRAHMRELYEELRSIVTKVMDSPLGDEWGLGGTIERFLRSNTTWKGIEPHLTRKNRNRILKGLVTAFEDDGL